MSEVAEGLKRTGQPKPYQAHVQRGGRRVHLGSFATAEEAALCVARSPEGQAAARRAASAESQAMLAVLSGTILKEEGAVPPMPPGAFKVEVVGKQEEECSDGKRQRMK